jgi:hypothetical protein
MMARKIKTKLQTKVGQDGELSGWYDGQQSYLWFGVNGRCQGILRGSKLYRLAKTIVKAFESDEMR